MGVMLSPNHALDGADEIIGLFIVDFLTIFLIINNAGITTSAKIESPDPQDNATGFKTLRMVLQSWSTVANRTEI